MTLNIGVFSGVGYGGANNLVLDLSRYLISRGHKVKLFLALSKFKRDESLLLKRANLLGKKDVLIFPIDEFKRFGIIGYYITLFRLRKAHKEIAFSIDKNKLDVVIATHCQYTQSPFLISLIKRVPLVYIFCEPKREFYEKTSFDHYSIKKRISRVLLLPVKFLDKYNLRRAPKSVKLKIIAISKFSLKKLKEVYGLRGSVIYPGIDTKKFCPARKKREILPPGSKFLSVGALSFHKGFDFILEALSFLPEEMRNLTIIGNGGHDIDKIRELATRQRVNLKIKNFVSETKLINNYKNADLFLYAPRGEPFSLALFEAMSCGIPVVAINEGGYSEILRKRGGQVFLVPRRPKLFANKIIEILKNNQKYNAKKKLARKIAMGLDWGLVGAQIEQVIKEVSR